LLSLNTAVIFSPIKFINRSLQAQQKYSPHLSGIAIAQQIINDDKYNNGANATAP
jgi:hypothetical protein